MSSTEGTDGGADLARAIAAAMAGIERGPLLDNLAARRLADLPPDDAARTLGDLLARALDGDAERKALEALSRALVWGEPLVSADHRRAIRAAAAGLGLGAVAALCTEASPDRTLDPDARRIDAVLGSLTLGHRTQMARAVTDPDRINRLGHDDSPAVIRNLLLNPRLTEAQVVRIAARRPVPGEVLVEVARARRWAVRHAVRRALVLNPYCPPPVVNQILPALPAADLHEVAADQVLHPAVRRAALALMASRRRQ